MCPCKIVTHVTHFQSAAPTYQGSEGKSGPTKPRPPHGLNLSGRPIQICCYARLYKELNRNIIITILHQHVNS